jgi:hypothetical protein
VTPQSDSLRSARNNGCIIDDFDSFNGSDRISNYEKIVEKIRSVSILTQTDIMAEESKLLDSEQTRS